MRTSVLLLALIAAPAEAVDTSRISVGVPLQVDVVGFAVGIHPELLYRPLAPDGGLHLRFAPGLMVGPELTSMPIAAGIRGVARPRKTVRPFAGAGLQLQNFLPYDHPRVSRLDMTLELGLDVEVTDGWRAGLQVSPEFGVAGGFGFGMAARLGVQRDL